MPFRSIAEAEAYALEYYSDVSDPGTEFLLQRYVHLAQVVQPKSVLDFGCGPCTYIPLTFAQASSTIVLHDPNEWVMAYIDNWLLGNYDDVWRGCAERILEIGKRSSLAIDQLFGDARKATRPSWSSDHKLRYDLVCANFSIESFATTWADAVEVSMELLHQTNAGGYVSLIFLTDASSWKVMAHSKRMEPALNVTPSQLEQLADLLNLHSVEVAHKPLDRQTYSGFGSVVGRKRS